MEFAGLVVGVIPLVELSVKYVKIINQVVSDVKHAKVEQDAVLLEAMSDLSIISLHEKNLRKLRQEEVDALRYKIERMASSASQLKSLVDELETERHSRLGWAFVWKKRVEATCDRIKKQQKGYERLLVVFGIFGRLSIVDNEAAKIVAFVESSLARRRAAQVDEDLKLPQLPTTGKCVRLASSYLLTASSKTGACLVIEEHTWEGDNEHKRTEERIREVANTFHCSTREDRNFQSLNAGIAQCIGYVEQHSNFQLIFEMPFAVSQVQSLRKLLESPKRHTLNARLKLATSLAKAVFFTHAYQYVHKNIQPSNILIRGLEDNEQLMEDFGPLLLAGFGDARAENAGSVRLEDKRHEYDIYRHHTRIGPGMVEGYTFLHDVYSLGVCLLEIGLWTDFLDPESKGLHEATPLERYAMLKDYARQYLPMEMGRMYTDVVLNCLEGVEGAFVNMVDPATDGSIVGMRYVEVVLDSLAGINV